jgi:NADH pyrophosphatase NudC (nudix superfamily)
MTEYRRVWPVEEAGPIRGQQSSMFFASDGLQQVFTPRSVTFWSCGKCGVGIKEPEDHGWPRVCKGCGAINDPVRDR